MVCLPCSQVASLTSDQCRVGSWLEPRLNSKGRWGLGCFVCRKAAQLTPWGEGRVTTLSLGNVRRHGQTKQHQRAAKRAGFDGLDAIDDTAAPAEHLFSKVLGARLEGRPLCSKVEGMGAWKTTKMTFCLAEAARELARNDLRRAESIALKMDSREGMFLVRYTSCDANLAVSKGLLGHRLTGDRETASNLVASLRAMLDAFATSGIDGQLDASLVARVREKVEVICADKASNEQVAGRVCRARSTDLFQNVKVVNHDSSHAMQRLERRFKVQCSACLACPAWTHLAPHALIYNPDMLDFRSKAMCSLSPGRVLKRPWTAVEPIQNIIDEWVTGPNSVTQLIEHSPAMAVTYRAMVQRLEGIPIKARRIKDWSRLVRPRV